MGCCLVGLKMEKTKGIEPFTLLWGFMHWLPLLVGNEDKWKEIKDGNGKKENAGLCCQLREQT